MAPVLPVWSSVIFTEPDGFILLLLTALMAGAGREGGDEG